MIIIQNNCSDFKRYKDCEAQFLPLKELTQHKKEMDFQKLPQHKVVYNIIALRPVVEESFNSIYPGVSVKVLSWKESINKSFSITKCRIELFTNLKDLNLTKCLF